MNANGKVFAEQYPRDEAGTILIPDDTQLRQDIYLNKVEHPSKNNIYLLDEIVLYCTEPGALVIDPMAGAGSLMYTARLGRDIVLIELEPKFIELLLVNRKGFTGHISILAGDCRKLLPMPAIFDLIVFSPPYANSIKANTGAAVYDPEQRGIAQGIVDFTSHPDNLSKLNEFMFNRAMKDVYFKCYQSLKPGGWMVIIIKDNIRNGTRVELSLQTVRICAELGFSPTEWYKHKHIGKLWGNYNRNRGTRTVEDEDIIMFRRPSNA